MAFRSVKIIFRNSDGLSKTIYFKAGQRDVVKFINNLKERTENK